MGSVGVGCREICASGLAVGRRLPFKTTNAASPRITMAPATIQGIE